MLNKYIKNTKIFFNSISIRKKLFLLFTVQVIIPLILMQYIYYERSSKILRNNSINYSQDLLKMIEYRMESLTHNIIAQSQYLINDKSIQDIFNDSFIAQKETNEDYNFENIKLVTNIKDFLKKVALQNEDIQSICLISNNKKVYSFNSNSSKFNIDLNIDYEHMLKAARKQSGAHTWYLQSKDRNTQNIYLVRIINDRISYEEVGLMVIAVNKDVMKKMYEDTNSDLTKNVMIYSNEGNLIDTKNKYQDFNYIKNKNLLNKTNGYFINNDRLVSFVTLKNTDWKIVNYIYLTELYKDIYNMKKLLIILFLFTIIISIVFSFLMSVNIIKPINKLAKGMKKIQKSEDYEEIFIDRNDELGYLSKTFNEMSKKTNHLIKCIYEEQITRKEAEIKALQAQINPHFLFNTLESINWMSRLNGVPEISEMVSALTDLLEVNMGRDDKLISLKDEFRYINSYIFIVKKRYEDRFDVILNIDNDVLNVEVPRLLIQPLVENAINHGVEKSRNKVTVQLNAYTHNNIVTIEVIDTGVGIDVLKTKALNDKFMINSSDYIINEQRKSIGLQNVNRRIKLFYGEEFGITLESIYTQFTKVTIKIPNKLNENGVNNNV